MQQFENILSLVDSVLGGHPWFVFLLLFTGVFYTIYLGFPQFRYFGHALRCLSGRYDKQNDEGDTSHFQALTTALSGTVGTGNIAGVAVAVHLGGPSALFWMLVTAFLGMTTKFVEVTLSHKYREKSGDGLMAGGPMYYMKNALNMRWLAIIFAVATVFSAFGSGNLPQINSIANSVHATFGLDKVLIGAVLSILLFLVIIGGIKRIAKVTAKLVPIMAFIYLFGAMAVLIHHHQNIIPAFLSIFTDIISGTAATGGFLGASVAFAFNRGVNRGLFSNEAGQGSAPIAHASARAHEPVSEGMVAILEPFIDTIIICFLTGMVLLTSGVWHEKLENTFQLTDISIIAGEVVSTEHSHSEGDLGQLTMTDVNSTLLGEKALSDHFNGIGDLPLYSGEILVQNGKIQRGIKPFTITHARSVAENIIIYRENKLYSGPLLSKNGSLQASGFTIKGKSLIHSAPLTTIAFTRSVFGDWGQVIVSIGLLLFAFSTAISWSYYGDRAMNFLFGHKSVFYFRLAYVGGFFLASFTDTTIIWAISGITVALMTIPNLFGILILRKDMKNTVAEYWQQFQQEFPPGK